MTAERQKAGDKWREHIKQYPKLDEFWQSIPEVTNTWLSQQIDIFAGVYPPSAATPPDVEQMAEKYADSITSEKDSWDIAYDAFIKGAHQAGQSAAQSKGSWWSQVWDLCMQNGMKDHEGSGLEQVVAFLNSLKNPDSESLQSAVQDATPQEWVEKLVEIEREKFGGNYHTYGTTSQATDWINENVVYPLRQELSTLRSELSAAQEENKRLRALGNSPIPTPPESGEQTKLSI